MIRVRSTAGPAATGTGGDAFAAAHARVLADPQIQFALPHVQRPEPPLWLIRLAHALAAAWPAIRIVGLVVMGLAAVALIGLIGMRLLKLKWPWKRPGREDAPPEEDEWRPDAAPARALLAEADALAAAGRYAEAARLLLQRSIEDIMRRRPGLVRPATTSRDLAVTPSMPVAARPAFAAIAEVVEMSLFADRGATAGAWERARAAYADFALPGHWR